MRDIQILSVSKGELTVARHKVGDSYLSDAELMQHNHENWVLIVFVCGAVGFGGIAYYIIDPAWEKWIRFSLIIISATLGGSLFAVLNQVLARLVQIAIFIGVIFFVGKFIWSII